jgi:RNA polymerase sigma-70 factor (ECF subfamily)
VNGTSNAAMPSATAEGWATIFDEHFHAIYRYVAGRLGTDIADDLAAETFLIALRDRDSFDPGRGQVRAWLFGIATNLVARHRRAEARRYRALARSGVPDVIESHEDRIVAAVTAGRMGEKVALALAALSQGERDVLLLAALADLSHEEIAAALEISYGTVGSRLSRARKKLRAELGPVAAGEEE